MGLGEEGIVESDLRIPSHAVVHGEVRLDLPGVLEERAVLIEFRALVVIIGGRQGNRADVDAAKNAAREWENGQVQNRRIAGERGGKGGE